MQSPETPGEQSLRSIATRGLESGGSPRGAQRNRQLTRQQREPCNLGEETSESHTQRPLLKKSISFGFFSWPRKEKRVQSTSQLERSKSVSSSSSSASPMKFTRHARHGRPEMDMQRALIDIPEESQEELEADRRYLSSEAEGMSLLRRARSHGEGSLSGSSNSSDSYERATGYWEASLGLKKLESF